MKMTKIKKIAIGTFFTILLGAIGSGVWQRLIDPNIDSVVYQLVQVFSRMSRFYSDSVYVSASNGPSDFYIQFIFLVVFSAFVSVPVVLMFSIREGIKKLESKLTGVEYSESPLIFPQKLKIWMLANKLKTIKIIKVTLNVVLIPIFILSTTTLGFSVVVQIQYADSLARSIEKSIEIIAPYSSTENILKIRSEYRQLNSKESFVLLKQKIDSIGIKNDLRLPVMEAY